MEIIEQTITLANSCELIGKSKDVFAPIKEAVINSFDSIEQRSESRANRVFNPTISVLVYFQKIKDVLGSETHSLDYITVEDNGIGFSSENLARFKELANSTKGLNNRGTGKIQIFSRYKTVAIDSIFFENKKFHKLEATWKLSGEYDDRKIELPEQNDIRTIVKMSDFYGEQKEQEYFQQYVESIDYFKRDILKHFLLRLWLGNHSGTLDFILRTFIDNVQHSEYIFDGGNIPKPDKEGSIEISTEQARLIDDSTGKIQVEWKETEPKYNLTVHRFKMPSADMDENAVYLCSKNMMVERFEFHAIKRKDSVFEGFRYLTSITGELFDNPKSVSQKVDAFVFPLKKDIESDLKDGSASLFNRDKKYIFRDEINTKINDGLAKIYDDVKGLKEKRDEDIASLAMQYGIPLEDAEAAPIKFNASQEEATVKLFETQARRIAKENMEIQQTYQELKTLKTNDLDPTGDEYRAKFAELSNKLLEKIPQQNKDELARYIIRRDMVVELLKLALNNNLSIQKEWAAKKSSGEKVRQDNEGIIHNLIFKRRSKGVPNDLWILNEEFVHFEGCSDLELDKLEINGEKVLIDDVSIDAALKSVGIKKESYLKQRPDIFIFLEEGKCVLVEFKAPDVDVSAHCDQIQKYARLIANYSRKQFIEFYGILIGETIDRVSIPGRYIKVPYGNYWFYPSEPVKSIDENETTKANLYQEIIPLSEIAKRAEIRNRSFAEKLGIVYSKISNENQTS